MKDYAKTFYNSKAWKDCRKSYINKMHKICEKCGGLATIVHHKIYLTPNNINDPAIALSHDNLEAVCQDCHNVEHHGKPLADVGYTFTEAGEIVFTPHPAAGV